MPEAKKFWLPRSFQSNALAAKVTAFEGLSNISERKLITSKSGVKDIGSSLNYFVDAFVSNGDFRRILDRYIKEDSNLDPEKFSLLSHEKKGRGEGEYSKPFWFDGFASIVLFYGPPKDNIGVTAGVDHIKSVGRNMDRTNISDTDLIINQLQGPTQSDNTKLAVTFSNFRWERMLTEILIEWARQTGLEKLYFLPSAFSTWDKIMFNQGGIGKLRYDVTAKRLGFKRDKENKPYLLSIDGSLKELFDTIFQRS